MKNKKLYRSKKDRIIAGVCGGMGEYFSIDPTIIRVLWALLTVFTAFFAGIIGYLLCWIIIPEK